MSPYDTSAPDGIEIAERDDSTAAAAAESPPDRATAASGESVGPAAIDALTTTAAPFRRAACLRAASVISRRCTDRRSERSQSATSLRSRL